MIRRPSVALGTLLILLALLLGCSGDDDDEAACDAARRIAQLDDEFQGEINEVLSAFTADPDTGGDALVRKLTDVDEVGEQLDDAYRDLAAAEPSVADDVRTVAAFSRSAIGGLGRVTTLDELGEWADSMRGPDGVQAGVATLAIDRWSRAACGVTIAD